MRRRDLCLALAAGAVPPPAAAQGPLPPEAATRLAARLRRLDEDGLNPADYAVPPDAGDPRAHAASVRRAASSALADLLLGRLRLPAGRPDILRDPVAVPLPRWQAELLAAADPAGVIDRAANLAPDAVILRAELGRARALVAAGGWERIPPGGTIEPGGLDPMRVPSLRARLRHEWPASAAVGAETPFDPVPYDEARYDEMLQAAVRRWQQSAGLEPDGRVGALTLARLNLPAAVWVDQLRVALDMRRGLAAPPAGRRIEVNIPDFTLSVLEGSRRLLRMAVVVGRPSRATPLLQVRLTAVQFNPPWGVPERNAREDLLPRFRRDPAAMAARGFRLYSVVGGERVEVDPRTVDWSGVRSDRFPYLVRQDSGDESALGRLKFIMPNGDDIYLHDTPERQLFARPDRAFSSGCIRLERPMELLDIALDGTGWSPDRVRHTFEVRRTVSQPLHRSLPVRLHYTTAVTEDGAVRLRPDLYGLDAAYAREMDRVGLRLAGAAVRS